MSILPVCYLASKYQNLPECILDIRSFSERCFFQITLQGNKKISLPRLVALQLPQGYSRILTEVLFFLLFLFFHLEENNKNWSFLELCVSFCLIYFENFDYLLWNVQILNTSFFTWDFSRVLGMAITINIKYRWQNRIERMHNAHWPLHLDYFVSGDVWYNYTLFSFGNEIDMHLQTGFNYSSHLSSEYPDYVL